jgi:hypothetical protein
LEYPEVFLFGANDAHNWLVQPLLCGEPFVHTVVPDDDTEAEEPSDDIYRIEEVLAAFTHYSFYTSNRNYLYNTFQGNVPIC